MGERSVIHSHNASILHSLNVGDLVQFQRRLYSHWAVYLGNAEVVHLAGLGTGNDASTASGSVFTISGVRYNKAKVCIDNFWTAAADSKARKNNAKDENWRPLSPVEIVKNAYAKLGNVGYNLLFENCEHFAKWCRYGRSKSDQVDNFMTGAAVALGVGLTVGLVYALAKYLTNGEREQEKKRKVPAKQ